MSGDPPVQYRSDIRADLDGLEGFHGFERRKDLPDVRTLVCDDVLVRAEGFALDDDTCRVIADVEVQTPELKAKLLARGIDFYGIGFTVDGHREELRVHCMGGQRWTNDEKETDDQ